MMRAEESNAYIVQEQLIHFKAHSKMKFSSQNPPKLHHYTFLFGSLNEHTSMSQLRVVSQNVFEWIFRFVHQISAAYSTEAFYVWALDVQHGKYFFLFFSFVWNIFRLLIYKRFGFGQSQRIALKYFTNAIAQWPDGSRSSTKFDWKTLWKRRELVIAKIRL